MLLYILPPTKYVDKVFMNGKVHNYEPFVYHSLFIKTKCALRLSVTSLVSNPGSHAHIERCVTLFMKLSL